MKSMNNTRIMRRWDIIQRCRLINKPSWLFWPLQLQGFSWQTALSNIPDAWLVTPSSVQGEGMVKWIAVFLCNGYYCGLSQKTEILSPFLFSQPKLFLVTLPVPHRWLLQTKDAQRNAFSSSRTSQEHQLWCKQDPLKQRNTTLLLQEANISELIFCTINSIKTRSF